MRQKAADIVELLKNLQWETDNIKLYEQAVTHSSYGFEHGPESGHNERLEFLGDAVLDLVVSDYLYGTYPELPEGELSRQRANLVCEETLALIAGNINLGNYLRLGKGEESSGGRSRTSILADALEALIGSLYLDVGFAACREPVLTLLHPYLDHLKQGVLRYDYKTLLQELAQARIGATPVYRVINEKGPPHQKVFTSQVLVNNQVSGKGTGRTKKEAEQMAARQALRDELRCENWEGENNCC